MYWNSSLIYKGCTTKLVKSFVNEVNYCPLLLQYVLKYQMQTEFANWICVITVFGINFALKIIQNFYPLSYASRSNPLCRSSLARVGKSKKVYVQL